MIRDPRWACKKFCKCSSTQEGMGWCCQPVHLGPSPARPHVLGDWSSLSPVVPSGLLPSSHPSAHQAQNGPPPPATFP